MTKSPRAPSPVDRHIGTRLRQLRQDRGWSQTALGERIGVVFQQVQKYERGADRISAGRLHAAGLAFELPITAFFEGYEPGPEQPTPSEPPGVYDARTAACIRDLRAIEAEDIRQQAARLIKSLLAADVERRQTPHASPQAAE